MNTQYRLHYAPDNASLIIRLALEALDLSYETVLVDRSSKEQRSPEYLRLNPNGLIPALETPDGPMFETGAILLWLADKHEMLAPSTDEPSRAAFLKWLFFVSNTLHIAMRMLFYPEQYVGDNGAAQATLRKHMQIETAKHLDKLEQLACEKPNWFTAEQATVLDYYVVCLLRWMALYPKESRDWFDIRNWPLLHKMAAHLEDCQPVEAAIKAEGLGPTPFTAPQYANPTIGSAT